MNVNLDIVKELQNYINTASDVNFELNTLVLNFNSSIVENEILAELKEKDIVEIRGREGDELAVKIPEIKGLFYKREEFTRVCRFHTFETDIAILNFDIGSYIYYESETQNINYVGDFIDDYNLVELIHFYWLIVELIKVNFGDDKIFITLDKVQNKFDVLSRKYGVISFFYGENPKDVELLPMVKESYELLDSLNKSTEYLIYFKDQIYSYIDKSNEKVKLIEFIRILKKIIQDTNRDYSIYLSDFSFDSFNENFRKEKNEYFSSIREILDKLIGKIVSIPISISATALAINDVKTDPYIAKFVVIAYIIYSVFTGFLLMMSLSDVYDLRLQLAYDSKMMFEKLPSIKSILSLEIGKVKKRMTYLFTTIYLVQLTLIGLSAIALLLSYSVLKLEICLFVICFIITILLQLVFILLPTGRNFKWVKNCWNIEKLD